MKFAILIFNVLRPNTIMTVNNNMYYVYITEPIDVIYIYFFYIYCFNMFLIIVYNYNFCKIVF